MNCKEGADGCGCGGNDEKKMLKCVVVGDGKEHWETPSRPAMRGDTSASQGPGSFLVSHRVSKLSLVCALRVLFSDPARWLTPVIPTVREAKAGGSRGQEIETILANM
ncbi:Rho-related GTP-binding protein RhoJ, partial [Plecturocebus cupreus]